MDKVLNAYQHWKLNYREKSVTKTITYELASGFFVEQFLLIKGDHLGFELECECGIGSR